MRATERPPLNDSRLRPLAASVLAFLSLYGAGNGIADTSRDLDGPIPLLNRGRPGPFNWPPLQSRYSAAANSLPTYLGHWRPSVTSVPRGTAPIEVSNCDDSGTGSLRASVLAAANGDTVDLSQLVCSTITLTSSPIVIFKNDLQITGPGASALTIDGAGKFSIFRHAGSGTLSVSGLTLTNGYLNQYYGHGGCIFSPANLDLENVTVSNCVVEGGYARGGGIFAVGNLTLVNSLVTNNIANGENMTSSGGGFLAGGDLLMQYSTLSYNSAVTVSGQFAVAGGADTFGNVEIENSTISGNQAINVAALVFEAKGAQTATMFNSTVSGNMATDGGPFGGITTGIPLTIVNSTIAFNTGLGVSGVYSYGASAPVTLQSTIIADNSKTDMLITGGASVVGTNNLIVSANTVPPDTVRSCPLLEPLADNGGVTLTHAMRSASPAIDTGSNTLTLAFDQRGTGFARVVGAAADIGAFEWEGQPDQRIFRSGFQFPCDD